MGKYGEIIQWSLTTEMRGQIKKEAHKRGMTNSEFLRYAFAEWFVVQEEKSDA